MTTRAELLARDAANKDRCRPSDFMAGLLPPMHTPWGDRHADATQLAEGIWIVHTPSHGGVWLAPSLRELVPASVRETPYSKGGWYEEDMDCLIPYLVFYARIDAAYAARGAQQSHTREEMIGHLRAMARDYWTAAQVETLIATNL